MMASAGDADMVAGARGEFIFARFMPAYDGMFAAAKLMEALAKSGLHLREITDAFPPVHIVQERIACPWGRKGAVMRRLMEETAGQNRHLVDGVKVWKGERAWVLVIPHSDKPYFVVTVESDDRDQAQQLLRQYVQFVEGWRDEA
jgi:mannose-1-phosphate guanylyltransferase/phosphomannomutase